MNHVDYDYYPFYYHLCIIGHGTLSECGIRSPVKY